MPFSSRFRPPEKAIHEARVTFMSSTPTLALFHYDGCPFCTRVHVAIARLGLDVALRDILSERASLEELVEATGRRTVPCLRIAEGNGSARWLHESADIIRYLEDESGTDDGADSSH